MASAAVTSRRGCAARAASDEARRRRSRGRGRSDHAEATRPAVAAALAHWAWRRARPGLLRGAWNVAKIELIELRSSPGLYLFIPLMILLQTVTAALVEVGFLDTSLHGHAGQLRGAHDGDAASPASACFSCFTRSRSLERERSTRLAAIAFATPIRSGSLLLGKSIALAVVALAIVTGACAGGVDRAGDPAKSRRRFPAVLSLLGAACSCLRSWCGPAFVIAAPDDHAEPLHDLCRCAGGPVFHGISARDQPDQLGGQLAALECGASERHQRAGARSQRRLF